jgi:hypothetical protein
MLFPMALVAVYPYTLILGPSLIIILAASIASLVKFPSLKLWIGAAIAIIGAVEVLYMPVGATGAFWLLLVSLATLNLGIIICANVVLPPKWRAKIGLSFTAIGIVVILCALFFLPILFFLFSLSYEWFWGFAVGLCVLVFGVAAGASVINPQRRRAQIGVVLMAVGACVILLATPSAQFGGLAYLGVFLGSITLLAGVSVGVAALPFWAQNQVKENKHRALRKAVYVLLAIVIVASGSVIFMRVTNVVHEQILATYNGGSTPNLILRGVITEVRFNYEVNDGYFYHIFPAYIVMNVTEFVWGSGYTSTPYETIVVYYEKMDVPSLAVGQQVEVCGYFNPWREDSFYNDKLSVAPSISGSYVKPL